jgi:hypothetical protein
MRARWSASTLLVFALGVPVPFGGCGFLFVSFDFEREVELSPGEVRGVVVRADQDGVVAPFASVIVEGGAIRRAGADGGFTIKGLSAGAWVFRAEDDADGDGFPERTTLVSAIVRQGTPSSLIPGSAAEPELSSVLLGNVRVDGTSKVTGRLLVESADVRVTPEDAGLIGRVLVTREFDLPTAATDVFDLVTLGSETLAAPDATGKFVMPAVGTGTFQLIAFLFEKGPDNALGALVGASAPLQVRGFAGETLDLFDTPLVVEPFDAVGSRIVQLPLSPPPAIDVYAFFGPPGLELPPCEVSPATTQPPPFAHVSRTEIVEADGEARLTLPFGVFDVAVCTVDGQDGPRGQMFQVTVAPHSAGPAAPPMLLAPVQLTADDPCGDPSVPDCDGDGTPGLPAFSDDNAADWAACVSPCRLAFGSVQSVRLCHIGSTTYDCDDDGDGQPDVTESPACYGLGRGTDLDGDGRCLTQDPFPHCAANNAVDCDADAPEFDPTVPDEYGGEGPGVLSLFDTNFGESGQLTDFDPLGDSAARVITTFGNGDLLVVGHHGPTTLSSVRTIRLWRVSRAGSLVDVALDVPVQEGITILDADPIAAVIAPDDNTVYVLSNIVRPTPLLGDGAVTKVDLAARAAVSAFGENGSTLIDVATFGTSDPAPSIDRVAGMVLDEEGVLWVVGDTALDTVGASRNLYLCALNADDGVASTILDTPEKPGACVVDVQNGDQYTKAMMRTAAGTFVTIGADVDFNGDALSKAFVTEHVLSGSAWQRVRRTILTDSGISVARAMRVDPTTNALFVAGELDTRLAIWRLDVDGTPHLASHPETPDAVANAIAIDASGNVFAAGRAGPPDGVRSLLLHRYSSTIDESETVILLDDRESTVPFAPLDGAADAAVVNSDDRLTLAGHVVGENVGLGMWRFNPLGPSIVSPTPDVDAGVIPEGDGGSFIDEGCTVHSDCVGNCQDSTQVELCGGERVCVCDNPCTASSGAVFVDGQLTLNSAAAADAAVEFGAPCIQGDVVIEDFIDGAVAGALSQVKRIDGALTIRNSPNITTLDLARLEIIDGPFTIENNTALALPLTLLPEMRHINNGSLLRVANNPELQTASILDLVSRIQAQTPTTAIDITANGCTSLIDPSCSDANSGETCSPSPFGFACQGVE